MDCKQHLAPNAQEQVPRNLDLKEKNWLLRKKDGEGEHLSLYSHVEAVPRKYKE